MAQGEIGFQGCLLLALAATMRKGESRSGSGGPPGRPGSGVGGRPDAAVARTGLRVGAAGGATAGGAGAPPAGSLVDGSRSAAGGTRSEAASPSPGGPT